MANEPEAVFEVGGRYENRRGPFEVMSIAGETMLIRWDDGREVTTTAVEQLRIMRNMEREMRPASPGRKGAKGLPAWFGQAFTGLMDADFAEEVAGTHWRSREQLGGAVTQGLVGAGPFISWAVYKRPQVHWSTLHRYKAVHSLYQAKFFTRAQPDHILMGLYLERPDGGTEPREDWERFIGWLRNEQNESWLRTILAENSAMINNPYNDDQSGALEGDVVPTKEGFVHVVNGTRKLLSPGTLAGFLASLPSDRWINLVIGKRVEKAEALAHGSGMAKFMSDFFNHLMPVFESRDIAGE